MKLTKLDNNVIIKHFYEWNKSVDVDKKLAIDVYKIQLDNVCYRQWDQTERIKKDSLQIGDLVFFRSTQSPSGWHCGTYIGETMFIHAANKYEGVKVSSLLEPRYKKAYKGAGRVKK